MDSAQPVFKSYGFVEVVEIFGTDKDITEAARVSIDRGAKDDKEIPAFIRGLVQKGHWKPFEFASVKLRISCPIFVARQWRTHSGSYMELSRRYMSNNLEFFLPDQEAVNYSMCSLREAYQVAKDQNVHMLGMGVPREIARTILPVGLFTTFMWVTNVRDLMFFLKLRLDKHAQEQTREYAGDVYENVLKKYFPATAKAFNEFIKDD